MALPGGTVCERNLANFTRAGPLNAAGGRLDRLVDLDVD